MFIWYSFIRLPRWHRTLIIVLVSLVFILLAIPTPQQTKHSQHLQELEIGVVYPLVIDFSSLLSTTTPVDAATQVQEQIIVRPGDNLSSIFNRLGFSPKVLSEIDKLGEPTRALRRIHPQEKIVFYRYPDQSFRALSYALDERHTLWIERMQGSDEYQVHIQEDDLETRLQFTHGKIEESFWEGGIRAGLNESLIMNLATIFGWDIDFAQDIRPDDRFTVIYEQFFKNGEFLRNGNIIAAEFVNQKELFQAIRHEDEQYYAPDGSAMRKSFLRAPVNFKYISSNFNPRRLHPVTKRVRPHNGIDYAARTGTPVVAAGDGQVVASGYNRYNGNYIFIKHSETYITRYLHLNRRYVKKGVRVKQGQRIGSVGQTGLATGPHLHYEFLVNGSHRNPRTVKLPKARSLKGKELKNFTAFARQMSARLNHVEEVWIATVLRP